jgi:hypothetical protein
MEGVGVEPNHTTAESLALYKNLNTLGSQGWASGKDKKRKIQGSVLSIFVQKFLFFCLYL